MSKTITVTTTVQIECEGCSQEESELGVLPAVHELLDPGAESHPVSAEDHEALIEWDHTEDEDSEA